LLSPAFAADRDLKESVCWLMRSALLDQVETRKKNLSMNYSGSEKDDHGTAIAADLVQADPRARRQTIVRR
jgi:hypothetical protein